MRTRLRANEIAEAVAAAVYPRQRIYKVIPAVFEPERDIDWIVRRMKDATPENRADLVRRLQELDK